jgi:hypothetical protein
VFESDELKERTTQVVEKTLHAEHMEDDGGRKEEHV